MTIINQIKIKSNQIKKIPPPTVPMNSKVLTAKEIGHLCFQKKGLRDFTMWVFAFNSFDLKKNEFSFLYMPSLKYWVELNAFSCGKFGAGGEGI